LISGSNLRKSLGPEEIQSIVTEIEILEKIDHPSVVKLHDLKEDDDFLYMILEYMAGGTLRERLVEERKNHHRLTEAEIYKILCPIVDAMEYCHDIGVVHRDLKVRNFLLTLAREHSLRIDPIQELSPQGQRLRLRKNLPEK